MHKFKKMSPPLPFFLPLPFYHCTLLPLEPWSGKRLDHSFYPSFTLFHGRFESLDPGLHGARGRFGSTGSE